MRFQHRICWFHVLLLGVVAPMAQAAVHNESVHGDLSGAPSTPTAWVLEAGANQLAGAAGTIADYDIVALTIPAGHQLDSLVLDAFTLEFTNSSFLALQPGGVWTAGLGGSVEGSALIGWALFDDTQIGVDLLPKMGANAEGTNPGHGLTSPLGAGVYTLLLQDTASPFTYGFTLNDSTVPEPATGALALVGLVAAVIRRRAAG